MSTDAATRANALMMQGKPAEALEITAPLVAKGDATHQILALHSTLLKALDRRAEALVVDREGTERFGTSAVAWHNLGATLCDLGRGTEAKAALDKAFALGGDAAETWGVYARALMAVGDHDGAEEAYWNSLRRTPAHVPTAAELAEFVWMRRGDLTQAQSILDQSFHAGGDAAPLLLSKAKLFATAGEKDKAASLLAMAAQRMPQDLMVQLAAAQSALEHGDLAEAERLAKNAEVLAPDSLAVLNELCIVHLAQGRADLALAKAKRGLEIDPNDQSLWGWAATAARAAGDPLYATLYDYDGMIGTYDLETPEGWPSLEAYLADLAKSLRRMHVYQNHPSNQSLLGGSQTMHLLTGDDDPALAAFFKAIDGPIRAHMARLGQGEDPHRARNTGDYRISGAWSVLLRSGGFHKDHFHPMGWLSSAFYVETPEAALDSDDRQGWIRFGQPPFQTVPELPAERFVRPKPGRLVLFPSHMWHGTVPFTTNEDRLTVAFDVVPA